MINCTASHVAHVVLVLRIIHAERLDKRRKWLRMRLLCIMWSLCYVISF